MTFTARKIRENFYRIDWRGNVSVIRANSTHEAIKIFFSIQGGES
jgi:hypothetical protein